MPNAEVKQCLKTRVPLADVGPTRGRSGLVCSDQWLWLANSQRYLEVIKQRRGEKTEDGYCGKCGKLGDQKENLAVVLLMDH